MPSQNLSGGGTKVLTEADLTDNKADVSIPVEYTVGATFTVRLPSSIALANNAGSWDYSGTVGVKGDIDSGKVVKVTPAESITMYDVTNRPTDDVPASADDQAYDHKDAKDATVAQTKQQWGMTELTADTYSNTDLTLTAGAMQSGKWKGMLPVNIWYGDELCINGTHRYQESITRAATCTEDGEKTLTCSSCGDVKTEPISATDHVDTDSDNLCDNCGYSMLVWTTSGVNLRKEPNSDCQVITIMEEDSQLILLNEVGKWAKVIYGGKTGYVDKKYITDVNPSGT